jgi:hypothetical protein
MAKVLLDVVYCSYLEPIPSKGSDKPEWNLGRIWAISQRPESTNNASFIWLYRRSLCSCYNVLALHDYSLPEKRNLKNISTCISITEGGHLLMCTRNCFTLARWNAKQNIFAKSFFLRTFLRSSCMHVTTCLNEAAFSQSTLCVVTKAPFGLDVKV